MCCPHIHMNKGSHMHWHIYILKLRGYYRRNGSYLDLQCRGAAGTVQEFIWRPLNSPSLSLNVHQVILSNVVFGGFSKRCPEIV